jgi:hypothetical protein
MVTLAGDTTMRYAHSLLVAGLIFVMPNASRSETPAKQTEKSGLLAADSGATLFQVGELPNNGAAYIAHGYAMFQQERVDARDPSTAPGATTMGEFSVRFGNFCVSEASAQVIPVGLIVTSDASAHAESPLFVTGVKVATDDQGKDKCGTVLHITYAAKLPLNVKFSQVAYTVFLTGTRTENGKPTVLPLMPF